MVSDGLETALMGDSEALERLEQADEDVDILHAAIVAYLGRLARKDMRAQHSALLYTYMSAANAIESLADMVETNLVQAGRARLQSGLEPGAGTVDKLRVLHAAVLANVTMAFEALRAHDLSMAERVIAAKREVLQLADDADDRLIHRLAETRSERVALYRVESELIDYLRRAHYFARRISQAVIDAELGDLSPEAEAALQDVLTS